MGTRSRAGSTHYMFGRQGETISKARQICLREITRRRQWNKVTLTELLFSDRVDSIFRGQVKVALRFAEGSEHEALLRVQWTVWSDPLQASHVNLKFAA